MKRKRKIVGSGFQAKNPEPGKGRQAAQDAKDVATIRRESRKPTYSWNEFMKELGYHDLVTPRRTSR